MVNLVVRLPIRSCASKFTNVMMWVHRTFDNKIFECGKMYYSNSIIINNFMKTIIPKLIGCCFAKNFQIFLVKLS
jgi:hypothetical protein